MFARDDCNEITRDWDCIKLGAPSADTREWRVEASVETSKPPPSPHLHTRTTFRSGDGEQATEPSGIVMSQPEVRSGAANEASRIFTLPAGALSTEIINSLVIKDP